MYLDHKKWERQVFPEWFSLTLCLLTFDNKIVRLTQNHPMSPLSQCISVGPSYFEQDRRFVSLWTISPYLAKQNAMQSVSIATPKTIYCDSILKAFSVHKICEVKMFCYAKVLDEILPWQGWEISDFLPNSDFFKVSLVEKIHHYLFLIQTVAKMELCKSLRQK